MKLILYPPLMYECPRYQHPPRRLNQDEEKQLMPTGWMPHIHVDDTQQTPEQTPSEATRNYLYPPNVGMPQVFNLPNPHDESKTSTRRAKATHADGRMDATHTHTSWSSGQASRHQIKQPNFTSLRGGRYAPCIDTNQPATQPKPRRAKTTRADGWMSHTHIMVKQSPKQTPSKATN